MGTARKSKNTEGLPAATTEASGSAKPEPVRAAPAADAGGAVVVLPGDTSAVDTGQGSADDPGKSADTVLDLPTGVTVTGQFNRDDPATVSAIGALVKAALAQGALPAGDTIAIEGEPLAAFEARSNVLGSHGFVPAGATIIVNRADFEALKAAGAITGEWPEDTSSAG